MARTDAAPPPDALKPSCPAWSSHGRGLTDLRVLQFTRDPLLRATEDPDNADLNALAAVIASAPVALAGRTLAMARRA